MNVHFISTRGSWKVVATLTDPLPDEVEQTRAQMIAIHGSVLVWHTHDDAETIADRLCKLHRH